jgi:hypothetical protein
VLLKLGITSRCVVGWSPSKTKKGDPLGRPRLAVYAARELARTSSSEG